MGKQSAAAPTSYEQWAEGYLAYLGAPASGPNDPRVQVLEGWEAVEAPPQQDFGPNPGTVAPQGTNNPLDVSDTSPPYSPLPGQGPDWNSEGVSTFANAQAGYAGTSEFLNNSTDQGVLTALENPNSTSQDLVNAIGQGAFANGTPGSQANLDYANEIGQASGTNASVSGGGSTGASSTNPSSSGSTTATGSTNTAAPWGGAFGSQIEEAVFFLLGLALVVVGLVITFHQGDTIIPEPSSPAAAPAPRGGLGRDAEHGAELAAA